MSRPILLGLTGSIGMGKSTTAAVFADAGVPVWDADAAVHRLYTRDGAAYAPIAELCPEAAGPEGIDRQALKVWIASNPNALNRIESVVHPLLARDRAAFVAQAAARGDRLVVLDMPLLFETGLDAEMDATLVVTAPEDEQRARVLARPGMTAAQLEGLLARQMPDAEKRARATHVIETRTPEQTRDAVLALIAQLRSRANA
jgi:dephospho-CoA kinase